MSRGGLRARAGRRDRVRAHGRDPSPRMARAFVTCARSCAESRTLRSPNGIIFPRASTPPLRSRPVLRAPLLVLRFLDRGSARRAGRRLHRRHRARARASRSTAAVEWSSTRCTWAAAHHRGWVARESRSSSPSIRRHRALGRCAEFTLEANPDDVTGENAQALARCGSQSRSLGAQSLLRAARSSGCTARTTPIRSARRFDICASGGIAQLSLDLIFALPEDVQRDVERGSRARARAAPDHILALRPHCRAAHSPRPLARSGRAHRERPTRATSAIFCWRTRRLARRASSTTRSRTSRWRALARATIRATGAHVPYAAIGPAAHRFDGIRRSWNVAPYTEWLRRVRAGLIPTEGEELLTPARSKAERVYIGLRTDRWSRPRRKKAGRAQRNGAMPDGRDS